MVSLKDNDGHQFTKYKSGLLELAYVRKPPRGKQVRDISKIANDTYISKMKLQWFRKYGRWYISSLPLMKRKTFGFSMIYIEALDGDGSLRKGFVHPVTIKKKNIKMHVFGFEKQLGIDVKDLKPTREAAQKVLAVVG